MTAPYIRPPKSHSKRLMPRFISLLLALVLLLSACQADSTEPAPEALEVEADATEAPAGAGVVIALAGDGLQVVNASTGAARMLAFDETDMATVEMVLTNALGTPSDHSTCEIRGLQVVSWENGLSINAESTNFGGWFYRGSSEPVLTTMSGVGIGTPLSDASASYDGEVVEASFGTLFVSGGLVGILDGDGDSAEITALYAGTNCIAD